MLCPLEAHKMAERGVIGGSTVQALARRAAVRVLTVLRSAGVVESNRCQVGCERVDRDEVAEGSAELAVEMVGGAQ